MPQAQPVRTVAGFLATAVMAVGICWWALRGVDSHALRGALGTADLTLVALAVSGYTIAFFVLDSIGLTMIYRRHLVPAVPVRHVVAITWGKQLLGVVFAPLTKLVAPLYFRRRWQVSALAVLGASEVLTVADLIVLVTVIAVSAAAGSDLPGAATPIGAGIGLILLLFLFWAWLPAARGALPRLRDTKFLSVLVRTQPVEMLVQLTMRLGVVLALMAAWWLLTLAFDVRLSLGQLVQFCAVLFIVTQLPVSIGGYGGPQGVCVLLFTDSWQLMSRADAVAVSLVWSTGFLLTRLVFSTPFAVWMIRLLRIGNTERHRRISCIPQRRER